MSRSYRKPYYTDGQTKSSKSRENVRVWRKRQANRAVRAADVASGGAFKRVYCSYDICDYKFHCPTDPKAKRK